MQLIQEIICVIVPFFTLGEIAHLLRSNKGTLSFIQNYFIQLPIKYEKETGWGLICLDPKRKDCLSECFHMGLGPFLSQLSSLVGKKIIFDKKEIEVDGFHILTFPLDKTKRTNQLSLMLDHFEYCFHSGSQL